jgi:Na+-translocating ferredoxin:NAD+ oxidoreductase RnfD subunit
MVLTLGTTAWQWLRADPRHGQIASLAMLLTYGLIRLEFDLPLVQAAMTIATALAAQALGDRWRSAPLLSGAKSALISALSLCLLLRTDVPLLAAAAAVVAVGSKFVLRCRGKHVFNPTNLALATLLLATDHAWVSSGQWGTHAFFAFFLACAGLLVVTRAERADVTVAFMAGYATLLVVRSLGLGEPMTIPMHRLESGAFLLFSFFMISDPKTTPDSRAGRVLFAWLVALGAAYVHFRLFRPNGFVWALVVLSPLVPLIDLVRPASRYQWPGPQWSGPALWRRGGRPSFALSAALPCAPAARPSSTPAPTAAASAQLARPMEVSR